MLSRQLFLQLFWEICNTLQFKKTWFNILLHCIHFSSPLAGHGAISALQQFQCRQQFWLCVSSNVKCSVWCPLVPVTTGEGCTLHLQCSEAGGDPRHGQHPSGWPGAPKATQQVGFAKPALQGLPTSLCCSFAFGFLLIFKSLGWRGHLNTWKFFFNWSQKRAAVQKQWGDTFTLGAWGLWKSFEWHKEFWTYLMGII